MRTWCSHIEVSCSWPLPVLSWSLFGSAGLQPVFSQCLASHQTRLKQKFSQSSASRQPDGLQLVFSWSSAGLQMVFSWSSAGLQPVFSQYSANLQSIFSQFSASLQPVFSILSCTGQAILRHKLRTLVLNRRLFRLVINASIVKDI